jgi:opacity protein-like surface antigen
MKKIAFIAFLLAVSVAAGRAQESRQDISLSGFGLIEPYTYSATTYVHASSPAYGGLLSYRFMLTPSSAIEANYGITYQNEIKYEVNSAETTYRIETRTQEASFAYVRSFNFRKYNPFIEVGPSVNIFLPIINSSTSTLSARQQKEIGALYGAGVAYEISPSFDIRAEFRGIATKVPTFNDTADNLATNRWWNLYIPTIGVAYHF